jgi:hypothetical protein
MSRPSYKKTLVFQLEEGNANDIYYENLYKIFQEIFSVYDEDDIIRDYEKEEEASEEQQPLSLILLYQDLLWPIIGDFTRKFCKQKIVLTDVTQTAETITVTYGYHPFA